MVDTVMSDNMHYLGDLFGSPDVSESEDGKNYCIAVPMPWRFNRLLMAWNVLVGRAVAVRWTQPGEQETILYRFKDYKS